MSRSARLVVDIDGRLKRSSNADQLVESFSRGLTRWDRRAYKTGAVTDFRVPLGKTAGKPVKLCSQTAALN